tara:strand:+ start:3075 stop:3710 length:636 start_codon:yes stop_codon:yes gene_type:complete
MSIDTLKSVIGKKGGLAPANRFNVIFAPPAVSLLNLNPENIVGSIVSGGFSIANLINDPRDISILCTKATLPGRTVSTFDHQDAVQQNKYPQTFIDEEVSMTFRLTNDYYIKNMFETWMSGIFDTESYRVGFKKDYSVDVVIQQLNQKNIPVYGVKMEKCFPTNLSSVELDNTASDTMQEVTVTWAYDKFKPEGPLSSTASALRSAVDLLT